MLSLTASTSKGGDFLAGQWLSRLRAPLRLFGCNTNCDGELELDGFSNVRESEQLGKEHHYREFGHSIILNLD